MQQKFDINSYWLKSGSINLLQGILTIVFGFGSFFLLVRAMPKTDFGVWVLFITATSVLEVVRQSLIQNGFIKYISSSEKHEQADINTASLILNVLFTLFIVLLLVVFSGYLSVLFNAPELKNMLYIYCITSVIMIGFTQYTFILQAELNFTGIFLVVTIRNILFFIFSLLFFLNIFEVSLLLLTVFHAICVLISIIGVYFLTKTHFTFSAKVKWKWVLKLFNYGKYAVGTGLGSILNSSLDQFMLGSIISTATVAIYNASLRIPNLINVPANVIATIVFPKSARLNISEGVETIRHYYERFVGVNLAIIIPGVLFVFFFPEFVITIIAGKEYLDSVQVLKVMVLFTLFVPFAKQFGTILDSIGYPNINFYVTILSAIANVILNFFLIRELGIMGAVYGTLISFLISLIVMQFILHHYIGVRPFHFARHILIFYTRGWATIKSLIHK